MPSGTPRGRYDHRLTQTARPDSTIPANGNDANDGTFAGRAAGRHCHVQGVGTDTYTVEYSGFPAMQAYNAPHTLVVDWYVDWNSVLWGGVSSGNATRAAFKVEVQLSAGGAWSTIQEYVYELPGDTSPVTVGRQQLEYAVASDQNTTNITVRFTMTLQLVACPYGGVLNVTQVKGNLNIYDVRIETCEIPTGEMTAHNGWWTMQETVALFTVTLLPPTTNFEGRAVKEEDPGGGGPDSCFGGIGTQSPTPPEFIAITGAQWTVGSNNTFTQPDYVGWFEDSVTWYRQNVSVPCNTFVPQRMVISCGANGWAPYATHWLEAEIGSTTVSVDRNGVHAGKTWP